MERKNHHLVAVPVPGEGHLPAMVRLISHLARSGKFSIHFVLMDDPIDAYNSLKRKGWPPAHLPISIHLLKLDTPYPAHAITEHSLDLTTIHLHCRNFQEPLERFIQNLGSENPVKCIISDYQLTWCVDAAENLGISSALLFTGCLTWSWFELNLPALAEKGLIPTQRDETPGDECVLLEEPRLTRSDIPFHCWGEKEWVDFTIKFNSSVFYKATWMLSASVEELENKIIERIRSQVGGINLAPIGPLFLLSDDQVSVTMWDSDTSCLEWLDQQPVSSVLYVAFGSLATHTIQQLEELATGIEASKQKFLWVARPSPDPEKTEFFKRFSERNRDRGLVIGWSPQAKVLAHDSVAAFLTHCGWNSTIEGVTSGKPLLCWPCQYDQNINRRLAVDLWKVGKGFRSGDDKLVDRAEVERVIRLVMQEEEGKVLRQRAGELSEQVRTAALSPGGSSRNNLQKFIESLSH